MTAEPAREPALARLGRACYVKRWAVVASWVVALVVLQGAVAASGPGFSTEPSLPDVESADGFDLLDEHFGGQGTGATGTIVFEAAQGVDDPEVRAVMDELFTGLEDDWPDDLPPLSVASPYEQDVMGPVRIATQGEAAGRIAYAEIELPFDLDAEDRIEVRDEIVERLPELDGLRIELGGYVFAEFELPQSEVIGLAFAVVILILAFGSVIAMGLPIGTALFGIGVGTSIVGVLAHAIEMPDFTQFMAIMIGLGVGIDYALFIVTRYREELHAGRTHADAVAVALDTAGRAVLFAGTTVVISLLGMLLMGLAFINGLAIGAAIVVLITMVASVTLLPALLGFVGPRIELTRLRGLLAAGLIALGLLGTGLRFAPSAFAFLAALVVLLAGSRVPRLGGVAVRALQRELPHRAQKPTDQTFAYRWSRVIQRRPWPAVVVGTAVLVVLSIPLFSLRLGFSDEGNYPTDTTTRQAYDLLAEGFGPGFNGPFLLVAEVPAGTDLASLAPVTEAVAADPGVAFASPAVPNDLEAPTAVLWQVVPTDAPQDAPTADTVARLRGEVLPAATAGTGLDVLVTGSVPVNVDFSDYLAQRLPIFLAAVLALSFVLLMVVFRSVLVPLKAVIMNLLSIGAAYGMAVAVFQWGWLADVFAVDATGPIEPFIPMMLFAIVFGLSMDYEVFLLSRVKEEYDAGAANDKAVADGLAATARVITAAAAIMVVVFGAFLLETDRVVKLMGFGLAIAVLFDATVVRMVLVPATMELLGDRNWWLPRWLDRLLPVVHVEGHYREPSVEIDLTKPDPDPTPTPERAAAS